MTTPARAGEAVQWTPRRVRITAGLMVAIFVVAIDGSIVATAIPTIAHELGYFALYPWLIAAYLLTSTTTVPLWGRLADIYGRRRILLAALAWFLASSLLCATATDMRWLIAFRALQGIGAGGALPVTFTLIGDLYTLEQRARLQGLFSSVWAVAALIGPSLGAVFATTIGWRWIFWVNLPVVVGAVVLLWPHRDAPPAGERGRLDVTGAVTLTAGIGLLLLGLDGAGSGSPSWPLIAGGALALVAFAISQQRAAQPTIPFRLLRHRVLGPATGAAFLAGMLMFSLNTFVPLYVQRELQGSAYAAGAALALASIGWTGTAIFSGYLLLRFGFERLVVAGSASMVIGAALLVTSATIAGAATAAAAIGFGMGLLQTPLLIVVQSLVPWGERGAATALNQFSRTIGGAIGVPLLGALLSGTALAAGLHQMFLALLLIAVATLATSIGILVVSRGHPVLSS